MLEVKFHAEILIREANPYVLVRGTHAQEIKAGWKKPMPVIFQINGQPIPAWHINMMPVGNGNFYLYLHENVRMASKTGVGDVVEVSIMFDEEYKNGPMHTMPELFAIALEKNETAKKNWVALSPSRQKEVLRYFSGLKSEVTIKRNVEKVIFVLAGQKGRFMAREWQNGA